MLFTLVLAWLCIALPRQAEAAAPIYNSRTDYKSGLFVHRNSSKCLQWMASTGGSYTVGFVDCNANSMENPMEQRWSVQRVSSSDAGLGGTGAGGRAYFKIVAIGIYSNTPYLLEPMCLGTDLNLMRCGTPQYSSTKASFTSANQSVYWFTADNSLDSKIWAVTFDKATFTAGPARCLDGNGSAVYLHDQCGRGNTYQDWAIGANVVGAAQRCTINARQLTNRLDRYINADFTGPAAGGTNQAERDTFTLNRLSWGNVELLGRTFPANSYYGYAARYLVQSDKTGLCISRSGARTCDPHDRTQWYTIDRGLTTPDDESPMEYWLQDYRQKNPLYLKNVADAFGNLTVGVEMPAAPQVIQYFDRAATNFSRFNGVNNLLVSYGGVSNGSVVNLGWGYRIPDGWNQSPFSGAIVSCPEFTDNSKEVNKAKFIEEHSLQMQYLLGEASKQFKSVRQSTPLSATETTFLNNIPASFSRNDRALLLYDEVTKSNPKPLIKDLRQGQAGLYQYAGQLLQRTFNATALTLDSKLQQFGAKIANDFKDHLLSMQAGAASADAGNKPVGRSLLWDGGGVLSNTISAQLRAGFSGPNVAWYPNKGNIRISFPVYGQKAVLADGEPHPIASFADVKQSLADGVLNFVVTLEIDKAILEASKTSLNLILPTIDVGAEFHFAFSYRFADGYGSKTRLDSISINALADYASDGGAAGTIRRGTQRRASDMLARAQARSSLGPALSPWRLMGDSFSRTTNPLFSPEIARADISAAYPMAMVGNEGTLNGLRSDYFNELATNIDSIVYPDSTRLGADAPRINNALNAWRNSVVNSQFYSYLPDSKKFNNSLLNAVVEGTVGVRWVNRSFATEGMCRFGIPSTPGLPAGYDDNCKKNRVAWSFTPYPNMLESATTVIVSSQANFGWPFMSNYFSGFSWGVILPRVQYVGNASGWIAFDANTAAVWKAGAFAVENAAR
jgi:hypothetical protein